ncbi:malonate decarboxylase holo-[acyl-carrier-protein] synthase [Bosea caraganae]|uniref:Malonate decarboxylase holo-[acyl-carrier-protein] synthase n=1 Tax=Bosea caraganae TaxID=2763117 RepID=A0A370L9T7_9HYPH|nr:malonate decarboxylase holo-[acyl-carrier-protein] synthase [Bosea caraganae]RDJ21874.1 malonate decarboxylase holo-[acyl-carrier-protein] synthase [Bosea caraganae]RDJ28095.1 malonate decarboxylase holo-[acyl-carrier-protein] synthase [Bosea caraganae]
MASPSRPGERPLRRHDLIFVSPASWRALLATRADLAAEPLVAGWVESGWPLIGRRPLPGEAQGVALGLPLPPSAGKRRLSVLMQPADIALTAPPPTLGSAAPTAPRAWWPVLDGLAKIASRHGLDARVFGSLAWQTLTGLDYLTERSDLDMLLHVHRHTDLRRLVLELAAIEVTAPMRLDGELIRDDGAAVNWRELHADARKVLVKTIRGVTLLDTSLFALGGQPS